MSLGSAHLLLAHSASTFHVVCFGGPFDLGRAKWAKEMLIDQNQDRKYLNISLDLSLSSMPCSALSLNLLDPKGANVMHVSHEIYKQRISRAGEAVNCKGLGKSAPPQHGTAFCMHLLLLLSGEHDLMFQS